ncbi:hypothetical protein AYO21_07248 [Fonsecaea monophora]|uniref:Zn(2)-C6 fungal-type domain-containing protein n=1 Tax=Fonsecaea monophora TaxID=254056 RepID=A0A177F2W8_9EURO|nr:hypothetical protein AYO21_07248 [Fonsecaea monophora]OAG38588.1 hypothetical protein AYO21_07248 [Fonsecaea monophora]
MACTECRQQKIRCDRLDTFPEPCSRCRRVGVQCVYSKEFRRQRRPTKTELQNQLDTLRKQLYLSSSNSSPSAQGHEVAVPPVVSPTPPAATPQLYLAPIQGQESTSIIAPTPPSTSLPPPLDHEPARNLPTVSTRSSQTLPRSLDELQITARDIDNCFAIFKRHCMAYVPMVETLLTPNECHQQSPLLFWTIIAVGSRKYSENPTLIILLGPKVSKLAKLALFAQEPVLLTIQAFLLLCSWPMPFEALSNDITPVLAGAVLQLATTIGLHVSGVGQEFARTKVNQDLTYRMARGRLWAACVVVSQRVITVNGTPPLVIPDTYGDDSQELSTFMTPSFQFQKKVSEYLSMTILYIQNHALYKPADELDLALSPIIHSATDRLVQLESDAPERIDRFHAMSARLHLLSFHLFKHRSAIEDSTLFVMYELACRTIELAMELDSELSMAEYGPMYITKFLHSAVITILRVGRAAVAQQLDLERGQRNYFAVINYHKRHAVRPDDAFARFSIILTQLWTSRKVFQYSNGLVDSLRVRSKARLGMSMVYDCFWWWRQEFGGQSNVYGDNHGDENPNHILDDFAPSLDSDQLDLVDLNLTPIPDLQWPVFDKFFTENWPSLDLDMSI